uniref:collagen alpha-1(I) chain-like n=1 Tax=Callithrix jacchus TaxID=9483 RepID=UPI00159EB3DB|nr:collagen alpha-1(I) chain-like [Callithrix jacchus]
MAGRPGDLRPEGPAAAPLRPPRGAYLPRRVLRPAVPAGGRGVPAGASAAPHWLGTPLCPRRRPSGPGAAHSEAGVPSPRRRRRPPEGCRRREEAPGRDGCRSPALPAAADPPTAPPPSRGERQSERVRRRRGAGSRPRGRGLCGVLLLARQLRARRSPPSAPPSACRPRPHLPGLLGLGFPGAPPWTSGSPPRDAVLPLRSSPQWLGGVRRAVERRAPGLGCLFSPPSPGHRGDLDSPQEPFSQPWFKASVDLDTVTDGVWRAFSRNCPEPSSGSGIAPEDFSGNASQPRLFLPTLLFLPSRGATHVPRAPKAAARPSPQPRCRQPASGGDRPPTRTRPPRSGARGARRRLHVAHLHPLEALPLEWDQSLGRKAVSPAKSLSHGLRLHPPFQNILLSPRAPLTRLQHRLSELEEPLNAPQSDLPRALVRAQGVGST